MLNLIMIVGNYLNILNYYTILRVYIISIKHGVPVVVSDTMQTFYSVLSHLTLKLAMILMTSLKLNIRTLLLKHHLILAALILIV